MRRFFENRIAFAATVLAFALAMGVNAKFATQAPLLPSAETILLSFDSPTLPPPPWCDTCCPGCPEPDTKKPDGLASARPTMMDSPTLPPPPWCDTCRPGCPEPDTKKPDGLASARPKMMDSPTLPPPPWCDTCCPGCPDTEKKPDGLMLAAASPSAATSMVMDRRRRSV